MDGYLNMCEVNNPWPDVAIIGMMLTFGFLAVCAYLWMYRDKENTDE